MKLRSPTLLLAALLLAACASVTNPVSGQRELTVMDEKAEVAEGAKAHPEILKEYGVVPDAALQAYVNGVGQKLAAASHRPQLKWSFTVLDSPEVNAFALPGGYIYITRGLMAYLDSEAELAGVLGHGSAMSRRAMAHSRRRARPGPASAWGWRHWAACCWRWPPACPASRRPPAASPRPAPPG